MASGLHRAGMIRVRSFPIVRFFYRVPYPRGVWYMKYEHNPVTVWA